MTEARTRSVLRTIAIVLTLGAASVGFAQERPRSGGELIFVVAAEPPSFDGHGEETFAMLHPGAPQYNTLLRTDPTDKTGTKFIGDLAESWSELMKLAGYGRDINAARAEARQLLKEAGAENLSFTLLYDEEVHFIMTLQWHRIVPHPAKVHGWTISPSHFLNQQLDTVWLSE